ncbi:MAG: hypothetical protein ACOX3W_01130 [Christensenellaceae bacterium]|jgi:hypothetical protein
MEAFLQSLLGRSKEEAEQLLEARMVPIRITAYTTPRGVEHASELRVLRARQVGEAVELTVSAFLTDVSQVKEKDNA